MLKIMCLIFFLILSGCQTTKKFQMGQELQKRILESDVLLIGENHDNPQHHQIQGELIAFLKSEGRLGNVYFEHLTVEQEEKLKAAKVKTLEDFEKVSEWSKSGWPKFTLFESLIKRF